MLQPLNLRLPISLIPDLQKPLGLFFKVDPAKESPEIQVKNYLANTEKTLVIIVGDFVSKSLFHVGFHPDMIIVDFVTQRKIKTEFTLPNNHKILNTDNPPGQISKLAWLTIKNELLYLKKNSLNKDSLPLSVLVIKGEEDLLVLPAILEAPIGSFVLYGQPPMINDGSSGIVLIKVTEDIKTHVNTLLTKFDYI